MSAVRGMKRKSSSRGGCDMDGRPYASSTAMWETELRAMKGDAGEEQSDEHSSEVWYTKSSSYWKKQEPTVRGMLGGMDNLHDRDINASRSFLQRLAASHALTIGSNATAVDVGAGIGRITSALLLPMFGTVDMLEQNDEYLKESKTFMKPSEDYPHVGVVERRIACGMQEFAPVSESSGETYRGRYNLIWIQWCIIYLTDEDLVSFLKVCFECLTPDGIVCIKDNTVPRGPNGFVLDKQDCSIMRSNSYMKDLFELAGARCLIDEVQRDFPSTTFPVRTWALIPYSRDVPRVLATSDRHTRQSAKIAGVRS